jgi:hypothetical protein
MLKPIRPIQTLTPWQSLVGSARRAWFGPELAKSGFHLLSSPYPSFLCISAWKRSHLVVLSCLVVMRSIWARWGVGGGDRRSKPRFGVFQPSGPQVLQNSAFTSNSSWLEPDPTPSNTRTPTPLLNYFFSLCCLLSLLIAYTFKIFQWTPAQCCSVVLISK